MERIRRSCGFLNGFDVAAEGSRGGLSLGWSPDVQVSIVSFSISHIDMVVVSLADNVSWRLTGFYGNPVDSQRVHSWNLLRSLGEDQSLSWVAIGDFNEILYANEKRGGRVRPERNMNAFRSALQDCDLSDLGFTGRWYTWERGAFSSTNVRERLDRGLANTAWCTLFPDSSVAYLLHNFSNHCPILLDTIGLQQPTPVTKEPRFRFNANWVLEEGFLDVVQSFWSSNMDPIPSKLHMLGSVLQKWSRGRFSKRKAKANKLNKRLAELVMEEPDDDRLVELMEVKLALNLEADKEEMFWEQRVRTNWLKCGDRNTAFFHNWASARKRKNAIRSLVTSDGSTVSNDLGMAALAFDHFKGVFTASIVSEQDSVLDKVSPTISAAMNSKLTAAYSREEIFSVVKDMAPLKASGLDGYPALFYQKCWSVIGTDVADFCLAVLSGSQSFDSFNSTSIVLIPKVDDLRSLDQFRPISLCSVLYKIIAKTIANRL
ncbi:hypothetical protein like AT1G43760 [Hibiscus trionum]|uniref:Reverse transcriptase n=1 Tax=Hibiscus trionum TaxID=183268 RepID=A0A9W7MAM7_HIBTR|nr:hypothetical protein like AT1G43760 [Hibiscus trionum]